MKLTDHVNLAPFNTLGISVNAAQMIDISCEQDLVDALPIIKDREYIVLGGGSNVVFTKDYDGIVLLNKLDGIEVLNVNESNVRVKVSGGQSWHQWVVYALKSGWHGLENLALIPGTVGAAPIQNIGAYGVEMSSCCEKVNTLNLKTGEIKSFSREECNFGYRESLFKHSKELFVLSVEFLLCKNYEAIVNYAPLADKVKALTKSNQKPTAHQVVDSVCAIRSSKLPDPSHLPNAGSFFKNPVVTKDHYERLRAAHSDMVAHPFSENYKLAAGWLIDNLGLKGYCQQGVCVHKEQALVIVNISGSGCDVLDMANYVKQRVLSAYGIELEIEPRVV